MYSDHVDYKSLAEQFKALGDPTRLKIFKCLLDCTCSPSSSDSGLPTAGEVCRILGEDKVTSNMSFHLKELRNAGLINMERDGRFMLCSVNRETLERLQGCLIGVTGGEDCPDCERGTC